MRHLSRSRESELADLAEEVANEYFPEGRIQPLQILVAEGITYSFGYYDEAFDGLLEYAAGRFHVFCNLDRVARLDSPRSRFTLAHELGHFFIDEHRNALLSGRAPSHPSFCEYESRQIPEREADYFASNLLMPTDRFQEVALEGEIGLGAVLAASITFDVSLTSAAIKYVRADFFASAVLKWNLEGWGWKWLSETFFKSGYQKTIESLADIPSDSATAQALAGEAPPGEGFFETCAIASEWFPFIRPGSSGDVPLIEQSVSLGRFGTLTFVYPRTEETGLYG